jgi:predicted GNAT superfamily acetyltransferase
LGADDRLGTLEAFRGRQSKGSGVGLEVRLLDTVSELREVESLQQLVWGMPDREVVPSHQLLAAVRNGGLVLGAFAGGRLVGFSYAFVGWREGERVLHSHMTAVLPDLQDHDVGYRLKCAQREWALAQGYGRIVWTFDPLQSRNAYFNLHKLGARAERYLVDYYGRMEDELNRGLPTDRLEVDWWLTSEPVRARLEGRWVPPALEGARPVLEAQGDGPGPVREPAGELVRLEVPASLADLRQRDPQLPLAWRLATREAFLRCLAAHYAAVDFRRHAGRSFYILERTR